jgi:hypothetical protein
MKWGVRRNSLKAYSKASQKAEKLSAKKEKASFEVERLRKKLAAAEAKSLKRNTKAEKWVAKMDKTFSDRNLSKIEAKHIKKGEKFYRKAVEAETPYDSEVQRIKADKYYKEAENVKRLRTDRNEAMNYYDLQKK